MNVFSENDSLLSSPNLMFLAASPVSHVVTSNQDDGSEGTLRSVLENAQNGDVITFDLPTGQTTILLTQSLQVAANVTIDGGETVTVNANSNGRVFTLDSAAGGITLKNIRLEGGCAIDLDRDGGLLCCSGSDDVSITLDNVVMTSSSADLGGAIAVWAADVDLKILNNTTIKDNAAGIDGGAIYVRADNVKVYVSNSTITGCTAQAQELDYGDGGAVNIKATGDFSMDGGAFSYNSISGRGGAIWNYGTSSLTGYTFNNNSADCGGAVYNEPDEVDDPLLTIKTSYFTGNSSVHDGGAIYNDDARLSLQNVTFHSNMAGNEETVGNGGAIYNNTLGTVTLDTVYFLENSASGEGAAFYNAGTAELNNTWFLTPADITVNRGSMTLAKKNSFAANVINYGTVLFSGTTTETTLKGASVMINDASADPQDVGSSSFILDRTSVRETTGEFVDVIWRGEWGLDNDAQYTAVKSNTSSSSVALGGSFVDAKNRTVWFGQNGGVAGLTDHVKLNSTYTDIDFQKFNTRANIDEVYNNYNTYIEVTGGTYDYDLYAGNARFEITGDVELERASLARRGRYLFGGAYKAAGGNNSVTVKAGASLSADRVYGGSVIASDGTYNNAVSSTVFEAGSTGEIFSAYGGYLVQSGATATLSGDVSIVINGNVSATDYIIGGDLSAGKAKTTRYGDTFVSISSGSYDWVVCGSGMVGEAEATYTQIGNTNIVITGGVFETEGVIFGGCVTNRSSYGVRTCVDGNTNITIDVSGKNKVSIASIYAGSNGAGVITGTTSVTFTGNGANLTFNDEYGGVSGDCAYPQSFVKGERSLHFNDFSGKFDAPVVQKMDTVTFEGSNVEITSNRWKAAPISCWEFDIDSSVTWATAKNNSFAGDTLVFGETGDTLDAWEGLWCVIDSNSDALFDGLSGAGSVTLLGQIASWDGVSNWLSEDYKLYVDSSNHDLIVATNLI